jgi:hypothetical protein
MLSREIDGVVREVDPIGRQVLVVVNGTPENVYVPPDCSVLLRGERVKLRIMQPLDRVRMRVQDRPEAVVARSIEVCANSRLAAF